MIRSTCLLTLLAMTVAAPEALAAGVVRRMALVAGANYGGQDRTALKYAVSDARRFAQVLTSLGGVDPGDCLLLVQPSLAELERAFGELQRKASSVAAVAEAGGRDRTEVLFYYSGHADEKGLLLGEERYSYEAFRERMDAIRADVRIGVLDACASGAITRLKGGQRRQAFLVDEASDMRGHAFLASSSADEVAQESDTVGGSFFTHYLVSGLRGAADVSGEGKVTLNEAYQFAFHETLGRTVETRGGAQHPAWDISLSGTGDVVMTDVRRTSAGLALGDHLRGRFFVRNADQQLIVELYKLEGRSVDLGLEPGVYKIRCEQEAGASVSSFELRSGERVALRSEDFRPASRERTKARGSQHFQPAFGWLRGRFRVELGLGYREDVATDPTPAGSVVTSVGSKGLVGSLGLSRWIGESLAVTVIGSALEGGTNTVTDSDGITTSSGGLASVMVGLRTYLGRSNPRPYLKLGMGPYIWGGNSTLTNAAGLFVDTGGEAAFGASVGGGIDVQIGRSWMLGASGGYDFVSQFSRAVAASRDHSGFRMNVSVSWLLGKGHAPQ